MQRHQVAKLCSCLQTYTPNSSVTERPREGNVKDMLSAAKNHHKICGDETWTWKIEVAELNAATATKTIVVASLCMRKWSSLPSTLKVAMPLLQTSAESAYDLKSAKEGVAECFDSYELSDFSSKAHMDPSGWEFSWNGENDFNELLQGVNEMSTPLNQQTTSHLNQQPHEVLFNE